MKQKRYRLRGIMIGLVLVIIQTMLYLGCLPTEQSPYGFCGIIFAFPLGVVTNDLLWRIPVVQLRMPILIALEIIVVCGALSVIGYLYGKFKNRNVVR